VSSYLSASASASHTHTHINILFKYCYTAYSHIQTLEDRAPPSSKRYRGRLPWRGIYILYLLVFFGLLVPDSCLIIFYVQNYCMQFSAQPLIRIQSDIQRASWGAVFSSLLGTGWRLDRTDGSSPQRCKSKCSNVEFVVHFVCFTQASKCLCLSRLS
jgi:hypothetical protein